MKTRNCIMLLLAIVMTASCQSTTRKDNGQALTQASTGGVGQSQNPDQDLSSFSTAYFASGCFWCTEAIFESLKGVKEVVSGYSGGTTPDPTYEKVGSGTTGYAESVKIYYDEAYHQGYEKKHPDNPYVQSVSIPRINRFKEKFPQLLKKDIH